MRWLSTRQEREMSKDKSFEAYEREEKLAALRAALDDGESSGAALPFDFEAFMAEKRQRHGAC
jgi:Arc/MetJ-type ribon-helix-helix transcriptional regulator